MSRKKKKSPSQKAAERWEDKDHSEEEVPSSPQDEERANGDHFIISLALIGVVAIAAIVFTTMQGGMPF